MFIVFMNLYLVVRTRAINRAEYCVVRINMSLSQDSVVHTGLSRALLRAQKSATNLSFPGDFLGSVVPPYICGFVRG